MTKCEIENDVDGMPQWISGELFTGSGKKYEDLKEKQVLYGTYSNLCAALVSWAVK